MRGSRSGIVAHKTDDAGRWDRPNPGLSGATVGGGGNGGRGKISYTLAGSQGEKHVRLTAEMVTYGHGFQRSFFMGRSKRDEKIGGGTISRGEGSNGRRSCRARRKFLLMQSEARGSIGNWGDVLKKIFNAKLEALRRSPEICYGSSR